MENFDQFVQAVRTTLQPEARANATANTLEQLVQFVPERMTLHDLADAWSYLSTAKNGDDSRITARRETCGELAEIAGRFIAGQEIDPTNEVTMEAWIAWIAVFSGVDDPRQNAMAATFERELAELQA